jgi:nucleotide sugar dehydrogenase
MSIAVIGLGKLGLPLAVQFASKGHSIIGVDVRGDTVDLVNAGLEPVPGECNLAELLSQMVKRGRLSATLSYEKAVKGADTIVVVVPLYVDDRAVPDFAAIDTATKSIASCLSPGALVIFETTLPVGTTRNRLKPMIEAESGLIEGVDFHLVFSPERVLTGRVFADLRKYPKVVGALGPEGAQRSIAFYHSVLDFDERPDLAKPNGVWDLGSAEAAELTKLAETTYRDVNIALANQFGAVISAANSQPFSHIHTPGISVGGHCIPVYPQLYLHGDEGATVVKAARDVNSAMPNHAVDLLIARLGNLDGRSVLVLGAAYRGGVKETAFSGVFPLVDALRGRGATPIVHDPMFSDNELKALGLTPGKYDSPATAAILHTDHSEYRLLTATQLPAVQVIVDGRGILDRTKFRDDQLVVLGCGG